MSVSDTIVALASGPLPSAIALVRLSGPQVSTVMATYLAVDRMEPRKATLAFLQDTDGQRIDQVVATYFKGPESYTAEDVLELGLHGGRAVVARALDVLTRLEGVRLAEPGEFTRRAVLAGRLDLLEAEGVADLVDAETESQREQALTQLSGGNSSVFESWHRQLIETMALIEVALDFPDEEDTPDFTLDPVIERLESLCEALTEAASGARAAMQIRDGFSIALIGPPNAGKSTLLNRLAARDVAIVTNTPGTTRDVIEVRLNLRGRLVRVSDTAGLRHGVDNRIEAEGIRRAVKSAKEADLVIGVLDGSRQWAFPDAFADIDLDILVANKADIFDAPQSVSRETLRLSAHTGAGVDGLIDQVISFMDARKARHRDPVITRQRHLDGIKSAIESLKKAQIALQSGLGPELAAEDIRLAGRSLERILGRVDVEDILGSIFSSFCIGK
ncbi:MAG: tRNA uridine-5-carboxymethylaminomethyl(34) synthesis GTPase MnmE [Pseudomonadota bacterium]